MVYGNGRKALSLRHRYIVELNTMTKLNNVQGRRVFVRYEISAQRKRLHRPHTWSPFNNNKI